MQNTRMNYEAYLQKRCLSGGFQSVLAIIVYNFCSKTVQVRSLIISAVRSETFENDSGCRGVLTGVLNGS